MLSVPYRPTYFATTYTDMVQLFTLIGPRVMVSLLPYISIFSVSVLIWQLMVYVIGSKKWTPILSLMVCILLFIALHGHER